jgi:hypothetical protein
VNTKKSVLFIIAIAVSALGLLQLLPRVWEAPLQDIAAGIVISAFYGLIMIGYLLRFFLVFVGLLAFYRMFQKRFDKQLGL